MPSTLTFLGPIDVDFSPEQPLPWVLSGELLGEGGARALVSFDVTANPNWPADLRDIVLDIDGDAVMQTCRVRTTDGIFSFQARRVFVHRDLRVPMRAAVPPQPVSAAYRWRWRFGVLLARIPLLRTWLS